MSTITTDPLMAQLTAIGLSHDGRQAWFSGRASESYLGPVVDRASQLARDGMTIVEVVRELEATIKDAVICMMLQAWFGADEAAPVYMARVLTAAGWHHTRALRAAMHDPCIPDEREVAR